MSSPPPAFDLVLKYKSEISQGKYPILQLDHCEKHHSLSQKMKDTFALFPKSDSISRHPHDSNTATQ
eukprot:ANDGO_05440.mRNA.1 hypothetical protein